MALACVAGCGGDDGLPEVTRGDLVYATGGEGAGRVTVIRRADAEPPYPAVIFLHGWGATEPRFYGPWLEHLARAGNAVVYPRYQQSVAEPPAQVLGNAQAGIRIAFDALDLDREGSSSPGTPPAARWPPTTPRSPSGRACRRRAPS